MSTPTSTTISNNSLVAPTPQPITQPSTLPSGTIFTDATQSAPDLETRLLGPSYKYYNNIKSPAEMGMSTSGNDLGKDVNGILNYVQVLSEGGGGASNVSGGMGNKFFLLTGGECTAKDTGDVMPRYIYVNNIPNGNIPFLAGGNNTSSFKGLIPGIMGNLETLNPFAIMQAFVSGDKPECQKITLETVDVNNKHSTETQYVTTIDLQNMNACDFIDKKNPVTGDGCKELFTNYNEPCANNENHKSSQLNYETIAKNEEYSVEWIIFITSLFLLIILLCVSSKIKKFWR
jgi:hypothetical protein